MVKLLIISFLFIFQNSIALSAAISLDIDIISLTQCSNDHYPVQISNVTIEIDNGELILTGTLSTTVELNPPISATVKVERDELGVWIEIPCENKIGSCTYNDLCDHGVPANSSCPQEFIDNNVPCRCPIPEGVYTIPPSIRLSVKSYGLESIYTGKYWAKALLFDGQTQLSCYEIYFNIRDKDNKPKYVPTRFDDIEPFVQLVR